MTISWERTPGNEVGKIKEIETVTSLHKFSRPLRQPRVFSSSFDWFTELSVSFAIGQSDNTVSLFYVTELKIVLSVKYCEDVKG